MEKTQAQPGANPSPAFHCQFRCINPECQATFATNEIIYRCNRCGELLEVEHDVEALRQVPAADWKALFEKRFMGTHWPYGSGVWGKKEWILPNIDDSNIVSMFEGGTNLFGPSGSATRSVSRIFGSNSVVTVIPAPSKTSG